MSKCKNYWSKEHCMIESKKYKSKKEFQINAKGAYESARKNKWLEEVCSHMIIKTKPHKFWNKEHCVEVVKNCNTKEEFYKNYSGAYQSSVRNGWLDEICVYLTSPIKPSGYWNKEKCIGVAKNCRTKKEFSDRYLSAYSAMYENNWVSEVCLHMEKPNRNNKIRIIYSYIILNKYVYVGVTYNEISRKSNHLTNNEKSSVYKFIYENNIRKNDIKYTVEQNDILDDKTASFLEGYFLNKYLDLGYIILNIKKTGNLGGCILIWTKEKCKEVAKTCKTKKEFEQNFCSAYQSARKNKWLGEICNHMNSSKKLNGYWNNKENCFIESKKYKSRLEFQKSRMAYKYSVKNKWIDEFFPLKWSKENCKKEALLYNSRSEFYKKSSSAYSKSQEYKWLDEICSHMTQIRKPNGYWTKEKCQEESILYNSRSEFYKKSSIAYYYSCKNKWLDDFFPKNI